MRALRATVPATALLMLASGIGIGVASGASLSAARPVPPASGPRSLHAAGEDRDVKHGSFTVTKDHDYVTQLRLVPGDNVSEGYCGTVAVRILGRHRIHRIVGTAEGVHYDEWVVGRKSTNHPPDVPEKVTAKEAGVRPYKALLQLQFTGRHAGTGSVAWRVGGNSCDMDFSFRSK